MTAHTKADLKIAQKEYADMKARVDPATAEGLSPRVRGNQHDVTSFTHREFLERNGELKQVVVDLFVAALVWTIGRDDIWPKTLGTEGRILLSAIRRFEDLLREFPGNPEIKEGVKAAFEKKYRVDDGRNVS